MEEFINPYHTLLDEVGTEEVDHDDLRWGLAVPEGWHNRRKECLVEGTVRQRQAILRATYLV